MLRKEYYFFLCCVGGFFFALGVDQVSKLCVSQVYGVTYNTGVSLGLFSHHPTMILTLTIAIAFCFFMWAYAQAQKTVSSHIWFGIGAGSIASNLFDRIFFGGVRDWLPLPFGIQNNIADWLIFLWAIFLIASTAKQHQKG